MAYIVSQLFINSYPVKLNNPLMGTETFPYKYLCLHLLKILVKLNNPLMGTETQAYQGSPFINKNVKLNNPH